MGLIPEDIVRQVLDRVDVVEVISTWIPLKRAGRNFKGHCPFHHEKTPSFVVNPDKQIFHCFGCGEGGNAISFVMKQEQLPFPEAVRLLADRCGVVIPQGDPGRAVKDQVREQIYDLNQQAVEFYHRLLLASREDGVQEARQYLKNRGIQLEQVQRFQLGYAPAGWDSLLEHLKARGASPALLEKAGLVILRQNTAGYYDRFRHRVIFPIFDSRNRCVAFGARSLEKDNPAKYINSPETPVYTKGHQLYGLNWAKDAIGSEDRVIVVEGYMDFMTPFQAGVQNIVASLGTALTAEQVRQLRRYTHNIVLMFDADPAGEKAMMRSLDLLVEEGITARVAALADNEDPDSYIRKYSVEAFRELLDKSVSVFDFKLRILMSRHDAQSVEGRAAISAGMLETLGKFQNAVIRSEYLRRLAMAIGVSEEALLVELNKVSARYGGTQKEETAPVPAAAAKIRAVEKDLLRLMLQEQAFIPATKDALCPADFHDGCVRAIVTRIFELYEEEGGLSLPQLMSCFEDQQIFQTISRLATEEMVMTGDKSRMHKDCVLRLQQDRLKMMRRDILRQMRQADQAGNGQRMEELMKEFNQLIKK